MKRPVLFAVFLAVGAVCGGPPAIAAPPFAEDFAAGVANWRFNSTNSEPLAAVAAGGPDGSAYISRTGTLAAAESQVLFRAHKGFGSSGGAYAGDWIAAGVDKVSARVRHNAPEPLSFTARFASEHNFPGASYGSTTPVPSGVWTQLVYDVTAGSPQNLTYEGATHNDVFSGFENAGIGNLQFSVVIPNSLRGAGPFTFDLDQVEVSVMPEPASGALALIALAGLGRFGRRRSQQA